VETVVKVSPCVAQVTELRRKVQEAEAAAAASQSSEARLRDRCEAAESAAEDARRALKAAKEEAAAGSQGFEVRSAFCSIVGHAVMTRGRR